MRLLYPVVFFLDSLL